MARKTKQNDITTPELISKINPKNKQLLSDYLLYLKSIQRSETTIKSYKNDLEIFFVWNFKNAGDKFFAKVTKRDIISFQNFLLSENSNSPARVRRLKATLSSLSNYIENILDDDPDFFGFKNIVHKVENPVNQVVREKTIFTQDELQKLLDWLVEHKEYQKACAVSLAMCSGRRKAELTRFKVSYFNDSNLMYGSLYKTPEKMRTKGRGNGKYINVYVLAKEFNPYLTLWIKERENLGINSDWLFIKKSGDQYVQITESTLNSWSNIFTKILGKDFYWHSLRHYLCTKLSKLGVPDGVIQDIVSWESGDMVKLYNDTGSDDKISEYFDENGVVKEQYERGLKVGVKTVSTVVLEKLNDSSIPFMKRIENVKKFCNSPFCTNKPEKVETDNKQQDNKDDN